MTDLPPLTLYSVPETPAEIELAIVKIVDPDGFLVASNNLSDVDDPEEARQNLGIVGGVKPDWNAEPNTSSEILNKPDLGTAAAANVEDFATADQGLLADTALQSEDIGVTVQGYNSGTVIDPDYNTFTDAEKTKLEGIESGAQVNPDLSSYETTTQLNTRDTNNRNRANHTGTQTAATITDFDTEVSNNTDVAANTAARHNAVTVTDSSTIDFTLTGQDVTASVKAGSIDESKLNASVNASLDLADSALQSQTFNESIILYLSPLATDITATTKAAIIPYLPYNLEVSELVLECEVAPTGSNIQVDINADGVSFLTTVISIDATETSSTTATTAYAIKTTTFPNSRIPKGSTVTVDIDQVGSTVRGRNLVLVINGVRY